MIADNGKPRWSFYPGWVVSNAIAVVIAAIISWTLVSLIQNVVGETIQIGGQTHITEDFLLVYVLFPIIGVLTGLTQYFLLRHYLSHMGGWIATTILGWIMPFVVGYIYSAIITPGRDISSAWMILGLALLGACVGLPQWWLLRHRVHHAAWWILAYGFGWGMIGLLNNHTSDPFAVLLAIATMPAISTGFVCWLLLDWLPNHELKPKAQVH